MNQDFDILSFAGLSEGSAWLLEQPLPTEFRVVFTEAETTPESICTAIATCAGEAIQTETIEDDPWAMRIRVESLPTDIVIWQEELTAPIQEELKISSGWVLAMQTMLHPADPLTHFSNLMRLFGGLPFGVHSICDLPTGRWFPMSVIDDLFISSEIEPPEEVLWLTRLVEAPT